MQYFTPELYLQFNSFDVDEAERADEAWDRAESTYKERLARIRKHLPSEVVKLSELCLHDALVVARVEQAQPAVAIVSVTIGEEVVSLIYFLSGPTTTRDAPLGWRFSNLQEQWLYDEVDMMNDHTGPFVHRILLSSGVTLEIPFVSVIIQRFTVPPVTKVARQSA
jgi:hypothetical protein